MPYLLCNSSKCVFWEEYFSKVTLPSELVLVSEVKGFNEEFSEKIVTTEPIIIDAECSFDTHPLSDFYGFTLALDLRRKFKLKNPIIFLSIFSQAYFEKKSLTEPQYKILFGKGTSYLEFPCSLAALQKALKNTTALSAASLHDVITTLCDMKGIVLDKLNHNLRVGYNTEAVFAEVEPFVNTQHKISTQWDEYKRQLIALNTPQTESSFYDTKQAFLAICNYQLTEQPSVSTPTPNAKFRILVIDDVQEELNEIKTQLMPYFEVQATPSSQEAIEILSSDIANKIVAVLSDWRLYADPSQTYWQPYQGYEVLQKAHESGIRALYALTSQADYIVHQLRNLVDYQFTLLKKQNLRTPEQWSLLVEMLYEQCENMTQTIANMPSSANWTNDKNAPSYKSLYIEKRQGLNGKVFFADVYDKADEVWEYVMKRKEKDFEDIEIIKDKFGLEVPKNTNDLFTVLVLRLIWIGLWQVLEDDSKELLNIYAIINTGNYKKGFNNNNISVELNKLCLTARDLKLQKMLPEERFWINKQLLHLEN